MTALPSQLALRTIADGSNIVASDPRNNFSDIQTAVNSLITALGAGVAGQVFLGTPSAIAWGTPARTQSTPANPTATTSATQVMMGLAGTITPAVTGNVLITVCGFTQIQTATANQNTIQVRTGTGTAPVNGAAATGTTRGAAIQINSAAVGYYNAFSITTYVTGLALATAVWIDLGLAVAGGFSTSVLGLTVTAIEV